MPGLDDMLRQLGILALLTIAVSVSVFVLAVFCAIKPTERKLLMMRPMSLAAIFAAIGGVLSGGAFALRSIATTPPEQLQMAAVYMGAAETFASGFTCFAFLAAAWLLVSVGMLRRGNAT